MSAQDVVQLRGEFKSPKYWQNLLRDSTEKSLNECLCKATN